MSRLFPRKYFVTMHSIKYENSANSNFHICVMNKKTDQILLAFIHLEWEILQRSIGVKMSERVVPLGIRGDTIKSPLKAVAYHSNIVPRS